MADELISREEVLGGLPTGRARSLVFLVESRTAQMVARARLGMEIYLTEDATRERDLAFLEAFALGREPPLRPTIQDLERYAPQWTPLVPENPQVRAAVAHLMGTKYAFTHRAVPRIRAALGLDEKAVQQAHQRLYGRALAGIYAPRATAVDRLRWAIAALAAWFESLPAFWVAGLLTVAMSLSQSLLALPIAVAGVGPLPGIGLLLMLGGVNALTMACMAEAIGRNGAIRYGNAFLGRMAADYLGQAGSLFLTLATFVRILITLSATYIGLSATMADLTRIPPAVWAAMIFLASLYLLRRKSINFSMGVVVLLAAINLGLVAVLVGIAFSHVRWENFAYVNVSFLEPGRFDPSALQQVFGVILMAYIGSAYVAQSAKIVLPRDASARSLILGSVAGTCVITILYCIWTMAINGAVAPEELAGRRGTVVPVLAEKVGAGVHVVGAALVILLLGMAWIRQSNLLFSLVRERLPARSRPVVLLPRRRGRLILKARGTATRGPRVALTYLGLEDGQPWFRLDVQSDGVTRSVESAIADGPDSGDLLGRLPEWGGHRISLALEILDARPESVHVRVSSPMSASYEGDWDPTGLQIADLLTRPTPPSPLLTWMLHRDEVSLADVAAYLQQDHGAALKTLDGLIDQGLVRRVQKDGESQYRVRLVPRRGRRLPPALDPLDTKTTNAHRRSARLPALLSTLRRTWALLIEGGRFGLCVSPELTVLLLTEWLFLSGTQSFAGMIGFAGVIGNSLAAGIFPILLLVSSRRKGEVVPGVAFPFLGRSFTATGIFVFFLANLLLHGLVIWPNPLERACALLAAILAVWATVTMVRQGAFAPRTVVELREDMRLGGRAMFAVTASGRPAPADVRVGSASGEHRLQAAAGEVAALASLRYVTFSLPPTHAPELKVWAHRITAEGDSKSLPAFLEVQAGGERKQFDLKLAGGQVLLPVTGEVCWCRITF